MSEEDWGYLESLLDSFEALFSNIPYGHRDKAWWDKFYEFSDLIKNQIKKVQPSEVHPEVDGKPAVRKAIP